MEFGLSKISLEEYRSLQEKGPALATVQHRRPHYNPNEVDIKTSFKLEKQQLTDEIDSLRRELSAALSENAELKAEKVDLQKDCKLFRQRIAKFEIANIESPSTPKEDTNSFRRKPSEDPEADGLGKYEKLYKEV
ncbi:hypothetical protein TELCIR_16024, partial [Teladorsagia circumcincta]